jgi:hypothetical protein
MFQQWPWVVLSLFLQPGWWKDSGVQAWWSWQPWGNNRWMPDPTEVSILEKSLGCKSPGVK